MAVDTRPVNIIYISVGSNVARERNIRSGIRALRRAFGEIVCSQVYESEAVGFSGDNFYNLVVSGRTMLSAEGVTTILRDIEDAHMRNRSGPRFGPRGLDLDLLLYNDIIIQTPSLRLPREEITYNAYVLGPLAEIAGDALHPVLRQSFATLWESYDKSKQPVWPVAFDWSSSR